jgi:hypothetical protein
VERVSETIKNIKKHNIGDEVTTNNSWFLTKGFNNVTGTIRTIVKDEADSWQYIIDLDDGRELQCDDWHLEQPNLNENQQIVVEWLKKMYQPKLKVSAMVMLFELVDDNINDNWQEVYDSIPPQIESLQELSIQEENQVLQAFSQWALEQEEE